MSADKYRRYTTPDSTAFVPIFQNEISESIKDPSTYLFHNPLELNSSLELLRLSNLLNRSDTSITNNNDNTCFKFIPISSPSAMVTCYDELQILKCLKARLLSLYSYFLPFPPKSNTDPSIKRIAISPSTSHLSSYSFIPNTNHNIISGYNNFKPLEPVKKRRSQVQNACSKFFSFTKFISSL